jgi:basic amino acid/polyamine antiporter, APA family
VAHRGDIEHALSRDLGLVDALAIGLGTMLGAGIFVLSAEAAARAGPGATLTYIAAGLLVLPIAMTVSELATALPREGGSYFLVSRTLGPLASAIVGPANWLGLIFSIGFYLVGFSQYLTGIIDIPSWTAVVVMGTLLTFLNYRGARLTGRVEVFVVAALLLLLIVFSIFGGINREPELHDPFFPEGMIAVVGAMGLIIVSFTGFEKISTVAEELKNPGNILPKAIIGSVVVATILYGAVLFSFTGVLPYEEAADLEAPLVDAAEVIFGNVGAIVMRFGGLLATVSATIAATMSASRIQFAMAKDHLIPIWFSKIHPKHHVPYRAVVITGALGTLLALSGQAPILAEISSSLILVSYALLVSGLIYIRKKSPDWYKPSFKIPLFPWLPLGAGIGALLVIITKETFSQIAGGGIILLSLLVYFLYGRSRNTIEGEAAKEQAKKEA